MKWNWKKISLAAFSIAAIGLVGTAGLVSAYQGNPDNQGPNYDAALHDLKVDAFDSGDYAVWKDLMEQSGAQGRVMDVVNEENFDLFVQAHNAALSGDFETSNAIRAELGLNNGIGPADGTGHRNVSQGRRMNKGSGQMLNQANFVDSNSDDLCDNSGNQGNMKGQGRV
ncbi:hypothetical protein JXA48_00550 [Candidatus Woesearchaeota archaeon]|nr:hypothetical protein [Candidatus Woesearchaeota archaeon]